MLMKLLDKSELFTSYIKKKMMVNKIYGFFFATLSTFLVIAKPAYLKDKTLLKIGHEGRHNMQNFCDPKNECHQGKRKIFS